MAATHRAASVSNASGSMMLGRAARHARQLLAPSASALAGMRMAQVAVAQSALTVHRAFHSHLPLASEASSFVTDADVDASPSPDFIALERTTPLIHTRLSYLDPATKPEGEAAKAYVPMSAHVFNTAPHQHAMHMAVVYYLDAMRSGTASTKTRSEVAFSGHKLRPQKGSGKARLSDRGSPMLRKGGVAHGPRPRDFKTELPRKVRELALRSALSARLREGKLHVVPSLAWQPPPMSTNKLARLLSSKQWNDTLFLTAPRRPESPIASERGYARPSSVDLMYTDEQLERHVRYVRNFDMASRNLPDVMLMRLHELPPHPRPRLEHEKLPGELHAYQVLQFDRVVLDLGALEWLEEKLGGSLVHQMYAEELSHWQAENAAAEPEAEAESASSIETSTTAPTP